MLYLRLIFVLILGLLYVAGMILLVIGTAIFAPKTFDEIFKLPME